MRARLAAFSFMAALVGVTSAALSGQGGRSATGSPFAVPPDTLQRAALKQAAIAAVDGMKDRSRQLNDEIFSFGAAGFQEVETHKPGTRRPSTGSASPARP